jgi:hypothetical protein
MWIDDAKKKLAQLRAADPAVKLFGASTHKYRMRAPLIESDVDAFERRIEIRLPEDYREFVMLAGDGGTGPHYGIYRLGYHIDLNDEWVRWEPGRDVGVPSKPFHFTKPWNLPDGFWPEDDRTVATDAAIEAAARELECLGVDLRRERIGETLKNPFTKKPLPVTLGLLVQEAYYSLELLNGAIPLCSEGCNLFSWLVVTGAERGHVWRDLRADCEGIVPAQRERLARVTFREWYEDWLETMLARAESP